MKYILWILPLLLFPQKELAAQNNVLEIKKGSTVFFRITREIDAPAVYQVHVPLYVVGTVIAIDRHSRVEIDPEYYLYTCSKHSDQWVKSLTLTYEKQSYEREVVSRETWNTEIRPHYKEKIHKVRPCTAEALEALTRNTFISSSPCSTVTAINSSRARTH